MIKHSKLLKSFSYAFSGIAYAIRRDQNFRIHISVAILVIAASIFFGVSHFEMGILGVMIVLVLATEMINTAIENMVDLITKDYNEHAKIAKDVSAGMVLLSSIGAVVVGVLIFAPYVSRVIGVRL